MNKRIGLAALSPEEVALRAARRPGVVHLGLGAFHRSHQAWYTQQIDTAEDPWGIVAFTGRRPDAARTLGEQDDVYSLIERSADGDEATVIEAILETHDGADATSWREAVADPRTAVITLTVTEAGYLRGADGLIDLDAPSVEADVVLLRGDGPSAASTAPGRLVDGLRARRDTGNGPVAVLCCDNLTDNGAMVGRVVTGLADAVDRELGDWIRAHVSFVSSMVDRITPATTDDDVVAARDLTGYDDHAVVVAEPFAEWVISGDFPAGRPAWETAGVRFVDDLEPYEQRKLWLLNGGHSLLAYLGLLLGHETVAEAMADPSCTAALEQLWDEAATVLPLPATEIELARAALRERFRNPRILHRLRQIASDGSQKLPVRVIDPLARRFAEGLDTGRGAATLLAAWWLHLTEQAELVNDSGAKALGGVPTLESTILLVAPDIADRKGLQAAVQDAADWILSLRSASLSPAAPSTHRGDPA